MSIHVDMAARDGSLHVGQIVTYRHFECRVTEIATLRLGYGQGGGKVRVHMVPVQGGQEKVLVLKTS